MSELIKEKVLHYHWEPWLKRNFYAFMLSLIAGSYSRADFKKYGFGDWGLKASLFTEGSWYSSPEIFAEAEPRIERWLANHKIEEISDLLDSFLELKRKEIIDLSKNKKVSLKKKLVYLQNTFHQVGSFIWTAHILEHVLWRQLRAVTPKYIKGNIDKYIGDAAYPLKKNALELMEVDMRSGVDLKIIWKKYAWMRSRDGFARPYKLSELVEHKAQLKPLKHHRYPVIPRPLILLYQQARELVYLRTKRTDVFYELLFWARPIFKEAARNHGLSFQDLKYFSFNSLVLGRPHRYGRNISCLDFDGDFIIIDGPVLTKKTQLEALTDIKGTIAQPGKVRGRVVVVNKVSETIKVKPGNILVTYMTSPDFLPAMKKAVAFVTDEGGLTCHAAIIAREMKKPCVIGTKIATRVLKDGDLVEVDADKGVVRIIKS